MNEPVMSITKYINDENQQEYTHDPMSKFAEWYNTAHECTDQKDINSPWPTFSPQAMQVATCTPDGYPSCRTVLMKHFDKDGIVFCTNFDSRKGKELSQNPRVALLFYWTRPITRQIRIEGKAIRMSHEQGAKYFAERPMTSRIASAISKQSQPVDSRQDIDRRYEQSYEHYVRTGEDVPCPENWGAFLVKPSRIEFWQEGSHRLADRVVYSLNDQQTTDSTHSSNDNKVWIATRLDP